MKEQFDSLAIRLALTAQKATYKGQLNDCRKLATELLGHCEPSLLMQSPAVVEEPEAKLEAIEPSLRWMIRRDMPEVYGIETSSFEFPWSEDDFIRCLRQRNCIGMVAEHENRVVGFMIYELHKTRLHVLNFATHPECRYRGIGASMVGKLLSKLSHQKRSRVLLEVRESNLPALLFFRRVGFRAIATLDGFYAETNDDAIQMELRLQGGGHAVCP